MGTKHRGNVSWRSGCFVHFFVVVSSQRQSVRSENSQAIWYSGLVPFEAWLRFRPRSTRSSNRPALTRFSTVYFHWATRLILTPSLDPTGVRSLGRSCLLCFCIHCGRLRPSCDYIARKLWNCALNFNQS